MYSDSYDQSSSSRVPITPSASNCASLRNTYLLILIRDLHLESHRPAASDPLPPHRHHPLFCAFNSSNCSLILRNSKPCCLCVSSSSRICSFLSSLNSSSSCSCHGYKTKTWNESAEVPITKFVRLKPRVNHISNGGFVRGDTDCELLLKL